ncbi:MAG: ferrochelatase [Betaproteobacteria bacterium]|nr:ferrochelatase [Betaproteobacteria bacterium]
MTAPPADQQYVHGTAPRVAVLLLNLGTPDAPTAPALRRYLREFLSDRRVVEIPRAIWLPLLNGVILPLRAPKSAAKYASIWQNQGSPLAIGTAALAASVQANLDARGHHVLVRHAMRYGNPSTAKVLDELHAQGVTRLLAVPLYPQYSAATTASSLDAVMGWLSRVRRQPELRTVRHFADDPGYIDALAASIRAHWAAHGQPGRLVMSFHGMPQRTLKLGDPYHCECQKTARLLAQALELDAQQYVVTFQSRFGKQPWLQPYTEPTLRELAKAGVKRVDTVCPGFAVDCLETLEEIAMEGKQAFLSSGGNEYHYIPCLNADAHWAEAFTTLLESHLQGWPSRQVPDAAQLAASRERARAMGAANV